MKSILNALIVVFIILLFWYLVFALLQFNINPTEWDRMVFYLYLIISIPSSLFGFMKVCAEY